MKKIMFALAAVAMATVASASTFSWGMTDGSALDSSKFKDGSTAYLFYCVPSGTLSLPTLADKSSGSYTVADVTSAGATQYATGTLTDGAFVSAGDSVNSIDGTTGAFKFYMAVISDDGKYAAVTTGTKTARIMNGTTAAGVKWSTSNFATYSVTSSDTPEPTSGLLLLVGAGMLALRRKQKK